MKFTGVRRDDPDKYRNVDALSDPIGPLVHVARGSHFQNNDSGHSCVPRKVNLISEAEWDDISISMDHSNGRSMRSANAHGGDRCECPGDDETSDNHTS